MATKADGLHFIRHNELDFGQWDGCLERSAQFIIYAQSWYLKVVCARWHAVVEFKDGKYVSLFPLPEKKWLNYRKVYQPFFTQQLGLFTTPESNFCDISAYIQTIPAVYQEIFIQINTHNATDLATGNIADLEIKYRQTFHLDLSNSYQNIQQQYKINQKRNLKKALDLQVSVSDNIDNLITLFIQNKGKEVAVLKQKDYERLRKVNLEVKKRNVGFIYEASYNTEIVAAALFLESRDKIIFLFGASSANGRNYSAMAFLLDFVIQKYAGSARIFDFEGSDKPGIAKFYANFGATAVPYVALVRKQTPWYFKWLSKLHLS